MNDPIDPATPPILAKPRKVSVYRHALLVRICHWTNALCLAVMLMSGLQIFNAHPALYWGNIANFDHPLLEMSAREDADGNAVGVTSIFGHDFNTTGVLGVSTGTNGNLQARGFPAWATLPGFRSLASGRQWHFFFAWILVANGVAYLAYSLIRRHIQRDLVPTRPQLRHIGHEIRDHIRLRFPKGAEARHYNVLQMLAYLAVIFGLLPLIVLAGITMSPQMDAAFPFLLDFFGGRQSARTVHFLCAAGLVAFFLVHIVMVLVSGVWNNIRSMITGRYVIEEPATEEVSHVAH